MQRMSLPIALSERADTPVTFVSCMDTVLQIVSNLALGERADQVVTVASCMNKSASC